MTGQKDFDFRPEKVEKLEPGDLVDLYTFENEEPHTGYFLGKTTSYEDGELDGYTLKLTSNCYRHDPDEVREKAENWHDLNITQKPPHKKLTYQKEHSSFGISPNIRDIVVREPYEPEEYSEQAFSPESMDAAAELFEWGSDSENKVSAALDD